MFTATEARERLENRYMETVFCSIKLSISKGSNFTIFFNENGDLFGDKAQRQIDILLNLGYNVEKIPKYFLPGLTPIPAWKVSW